MIAIAFRFPAGGRYHATAWGTHVNEGVPEWPPSPWRILRALIATARWKSGGPTSAEPPRLRDLVEQLAAAPPPRYALPPAAAAHTRHYLPLGDLERSKAFDTFVQAVPDALLVVLWEAELAPALREYLAALLARLPYLGRAESLCEAELLPADLSPLPLANVLPSAPGAPPSPEFETVRLLAPLPPADYAAWVAPRLGAPGRKRTDRERAALPPPDLFTALHLDTADWRDTGWSQPPGSRWLEYTRPARPFQLAAPPAPLARPSRISLSGNSPQVRLPTVARFALQAPVRESITRALSLGERFHRALCARSTAAPVFSGKRDGTPIEGHDHAYYFTECDERGLITHLTVVARMGFDLVALQALRSLRETWAQGSPGLKCLLLGVGHSDDFPGLPLLRTSRDWISHTPFIPVRHVQRSRNGKPRLDAACGCPRGGPEHDLRRLLKENGFPAPAFIESIEALELPGRRVRWPLFLRDRQHGIGTGAVGRPGYGFRLRFDQPIQGPLALGYGAHFGLGLFLPVAEPPAPESPPRSGSS